MGDINQFGKLIMVIGIMMLGVGALIAFGSKLLPLGRLPGDVFFRKGNFTFYFPIVTSIVISILLTIILNFLNKK